MRASISSGGTARATNLGESAAIGTTGVCFGVAIGPPGEGMGIGVWAAGAGIGVFWAAGAGIDEIRGAGRAEINSRGGSMTGSGRSFPASMFCQALFRCLCPKRTTRHACPDPH